MKKAYKVDAWKIVEEGWDESQQQASESIFSLGNGRMGQRANFEEDFSGKSLQGSYVAGVYYPDKTRVGWWKNGYPEYFAKVLNSCNWIGISIRINGYPLDLHKVQVENFYRELDMQRGILSRRFEARFSDGARVKVEAERFLSMTRDEVGCIRYSITPLSGEVEISAKPYLDFNVRNADSNYDEKFWEEVEKSAASQSPYVIAKTRKLDFQVAVSMRFQTFVDGQLLNQDPEVSEDYSFVSQQVALSVSKDKTFTIEKFAGVVSSLNYDSQDLGAQCQKVASKAMEVGFDELRREQEAAWAVKWANSDIQIEGDTEAQQGIRFNIFQLNQTFTGVDSRLNIGPKGFTGEKYGGSTYWDTEAYCIPFYLATAGPEVARNLLLYRYKQLNKAIENAQKLGFTNGAALFPMVTMNGEECHNEWEITFEEIHRNGAIAYAIYNYERQTEDYEYVALYGIAVLIGIARFWAQRVNWSEAKKKFVMLGVTGPNEYENNVNNNWYTSYIATWCLRFAREKWNWLEKNHPDKAADWRLKLEFQESELLNWQNIVNQMYFPYSEEHQVFLQQEGFLDKEWKLAADLDPKQRPINQHWSWDRILRSVFIKQADVLQGFYFFENDFDNETLKRHFDFYEPITVHESSLSPCVHAILAARLRKEEKAYEMYLRTSRLDLDDYNKEVHEGLHITSMAGTWISVVQGFGGMRIVEGDLHFEPLLPENWKNLNFKLIWKGTRLEIRVSPGSFTVKNLGDKAAEIVLFQEKSTIPAQAETTLNWQIA